MKRRRIGRGCILGFALAAGIAGMAQAQPEFSRERELTGVEAAAKTASFACETALKAGKPAGCDRYHAAVLQAMTLEARRLEWCQTQTGSEASNIRIPDSCLGKTNTDMRVEAVTRLERKVSPASWRKFDQAMAQVQ